MGLFSKLKHKQIKEENEPYKVSSPVKGKVVDIKETNDPLFNTEALGKGVGILAENNVVVAPIGGEIKTFFPTKHAIGISTQEGVDILIHVGIDTVELNGEFFKALKKQGDTVNRGEKLLEVDFDGIKGKGYDSTVLLVVTNTQDYTSVKVCEGNKDITDTVIEIEK